jgi:hypothetical protein
VDWAVCGGAVAGAVPGQQILDPPGRMIWQTGEHVGELGPRVDIVQLGGVNQRVH